MAGRRDADVLEIVVCQPAEQLAVDVVGAENLGILGETDPAEPTVDVQVQPPPGLLSAAVFEKGCVIGAHRDSKGCLEPTWMRHVDADHATVGSPRRPTI